MFETQANRWPYFCELLPDLFRYVVRHLLCDTAAEIDPCISDQPIRELARSSSALGFAITDPEPDAAETAGQGLL